MVIIALAAIVFYDIRDRGLVMGILFDTVLFLPISINLRPS